MASHRSMGKAVNGRLTVATDAQADNVRADGIETDLGLNAVAWLDFDQVAVGYQAFNVG
ncbi:MULTISPECIES: hypothetical protein [unclassified Pseudomonas]|uniref:hypothetical protein n=1 Tax=unclassified Pseudomonas TaxID=196821 RepID=UPI001314E04D|nr:MULTISPECIES: hypothetical protein [unclassified Pseudomonas]